MKKVIAAFSSGFIFGVGLLFSGMTDPNKVIGFLDVTGEWNPALMFVMVGAIAVHAVASRLILRQPAPLFDTTFHLPTQTKFDTRLILGAAIFGVGWGIAGYCPGPALVSLGTGSVDMISFVGIMILGMYLAQVFNNLLALRSGKKL